MLMMFMATGKHWLCSVISSYWFNLDRYQTNEFCIKIPLILQRPFVLHLQTIGNIVILCIWLDFNILCSKCQTLHDVISTVHL